MSSKGKTAASVDLTHHLSLLSRSRQPSPLKDIIKYMFEPGMISLAGGLPHPSLFPFHSMTAEVFAPTTNLDPDESAAPQLQTISLARDGPAGANTLSKAMQYTGGSGDATLTKICYDFTKQVFTPAREDFQVLLHGGNTVGWAIVMQTLCEPGEYVLVEQFVYPSAQAFFIPMGCKAAPVQIDGDGMIPESLDEIMTNWNRDHPGVKKPHVMYTVPVGQNPCGCTMTGDRKKAVYELAVKHDIIIVEDDPYYWLQLPAYHLPSERRQLNGHAPPAELAPTYVSFDYQGRVIRLDTFSKVVAPGTRIGWFTCSPMFQERLIRAIEVTTQAPSGWSQAIVIELLQKWGHDGYLAWLSSIKDSYTTRRNWMCDALSEHLEIREAVPATDGVTASLKKADGSAVPILTFVPPRAGMFIWTKVHLEQNARYKELRETLDLDEARTKWSEEFWHALIKNKVLLTPGSYYYPWQGEGIEPKLEKDTTYFRLAYSYETRVDIEQGIDRMMEVIRKEWA